MSISKLRSEDRPLIQRSYCVAGSAQLVLTSVTVATKIALDQLGIVSPLSSYLVPVSVFSAGTAFATFAAGAVASGGQAELAENAEGTGQISLTYGRGGSKESFTITVNQRPSEDVREKSAQQLESDGATLEALQRSPQTQATSLVADSSENLHMYETGSLAGTPMQVLTPRDLFESNRLAVFTEDTLVPFDPRVEMRMGQKYLVLHDLGFIRQAKYNEEDAVAEKKRKVAEACQRIINFSPTTDSVFQLHNDVTFLLFFANVDPRAVDSLLKTYCEQERTKILVEMLLKFGSLVGEKVPLNFPVLKMRPGNKLVGSIVGVPTTEGKKFGVVVSSTEDYFVCCIGSHIYRSFRREDIDYLSPGHFIKHAQLLKYACGLQPMYSQETVHALLPSGYIAANIAPLLTHKALVEREKKPFDAPFPIYWGVNVQHEGTKLSRSLDFGTDIKYALVPQEQVTMVTRWLQAKGVNIPVFSIEEGQQSLF